MDATNYFTPFISALQSLYPNIPLDYLEKLAWSGLGDYKPHPTLANTYIPIGTTGWISLSDEERKAIIGVVKQEKEANPDGMDDRRGVLIICN